MQSPSLTPIRRQPATVNSVHGDSKLWWKLRRKTSTFAEISLELVRRPRVPGVVCVSSVVALTDVFDQVRVKPSEFNNVQNADCASVDWTHRCLSSAHIWKTANLLLLMLTEASRSSNSLAATSWVNLLENRRRFCQVKALVWPAEAFFLEMTQCQWEKTERDVDALIGRCHQNDATHLNSSIWFYFLPWLWNVFRWHQVCAAQLGCDGL